MSIRRIQNLLDAQLATVANLPTLQKENTRFNKLPSTFTRSTINPAQSNVLTIGYDAQTERQGLYSIDTYVQQDYGSDAAHDIADAIVAAFPVGLQLTDGTLTVTVKVASVMTGGIFETFYGVPVSVQWSSFSQGQ